MVIRQQGGGPADKCGFKVRQQGFIIGPDLRVAVPGIDIGKFRQLQDLASLFELMLLKEAGLIENDNTPTGATMMPAAVRCVTMKQSRSLLHQMWDEECQH